MPAKLRAARGQPSRKPDEESGGLQSGTPLAALQVSPWMSIAETCRYLGVSRTTLWRMRLPVHRVGEMPRYYRPEVDAALLSRGAQ